MRRLASDCSTWSRNSRASTVARTWPAFTRSPRSAEILSTVPGTSALTWLSSQASRLPTVSTLRWTARVSTRATVTGSGFRSAAFFAGSWAWPCPHAASRNARRSAGAARLIPRPARRRGGAPGRGSRPRGRRGGGGAPQAGDHALAVGGALAPHPRAAPCHLLGLPPPAHAVALGREEKP